MPCVDLHSAEDYASIHYTTNTLYSNVSGFDPDKPTIVLLHPVFLDSTWLDLQMGDSRFKTQFNLIAFDMRSAGKSTCRPSGRHDSWVDAADLASAFSHIFSSEGTSIYCALRFAVLFPELCLSLTLVNVPAPAELKWIYKNIDELIHAACFAGDMTRFEKSAFECLEFLFGPDSDPDLIDELVTYWELSHPPCQRVRVAETTSLYINRSPLSNEALASITQPVLIIQGEKNELCPMKYAEKLVSALKGVTDGPVLYDVKGATSMISVVPGPASIVNNVFYKFLKRLPHHRSDLVQPESSITERMRMALGNLAEITGDPDMASLDPLCSLSFCCLTPEVVKGQSDLLKHYSTEVRVALNPSLIENEGRPLRKYSQRNQEGWSYSEIGTPSVHGSANSERSRPDTESLQKTLGRSVTLLSPSDTLSSLQKMPFGTTITADKRTVKGSSARSIGTSSVISSHRKF
ncbi:Alpha/Beta hydrolase protein [Pholiota molesta]|nr:Alpha/Beta hydrolase protein [Pholiota molesta]